MLLNIIIRKYTILYAYRYKLEFVQSAANMCFQCLLRTEKLR